MVDVTFASFPQIANFIKKRNRSHTISVSSLKYELLDLPYAKIYSIMNQMVKLGYVTRVSTCPSLHVWKLLKK